MSNPSITTTMRLQFGELNITPRVVDRLHELDFTVAELEAAVADHKSGLDGEPSVYVGTYGKYNDGSLRGLWIDLSTFFGKPKRQADNDDYDEFINFCLAIHADEADPELMAQDYECFPRQWYSEGFLLRKRPADDMSEEDFDHIKVIALALCSAKNTQKCVTNTVPMQSTITWSCTMNSTTSRLSRSAWLAKNPTAASGTARKSFLPFGRSCFAVARHIVEECYDLERTMGGLERYFDYEAFGRELFMYDYTMGANGNVFRNI